jgi:hypothetical protein
VAVVVGHICAFPNGIRRCRGENRGAMFAEVLGRQSICKEPADSYTLHLRVSGLRCTPVLDLQCLM